MASSENRIGRLIQDGAHDGEFNMAADVFLSSQAHRTNEIILRLYTWEVPTLSLGYHQRLKENQIERCARRGVPIVRRPTGGRAVLHDNELTYAIAIPAGHPLLFGGREAILKDIGSAFVTAAKSLGLRAELVRSGSHNNINRSLKQGSPLCFDSASRWEVQLNGHKWIGSAQRFLPEAFLQHGSILLGQSSISIGELLKQDEPSTDFGDVKTYALQLKRAIPYAIAEKLNLTWRNQDFCQREKEEINRFKLEGR